MQGAQVERRNVGGAAAARGRGDPGASGTAERGARYVPSEVGLDGSRAARDISEPRSLLDVFNEAKMTAGLTIVRKLMTWLVLALLAGAFV